ncbi:MAG: TauD/TfdA family dioxygenase [Novosphingobium sp.]|nr:TauD/TfdA family dioxygenase [Novosphingobium sp.]MCP5400972.1 TauD/TfdA family dioxygenase [Novosphingobium sp.]
MSTLDIRPLGEEFSFGARIRGVNRDNVTDEAVRRQMRDTFEDRGMIVFEDIEQSEDMQYALSDVFGPPQVYAIKDTSIEDDKRQGVISIGAEEGKGTIEDVDGRRRAGHVPWHFDACYVPKLNRAGVLRVVSNPPEGGKTGFADGVQIYQALSPEWKARADALSVIYYQYNMFDKQRFGMPDGWQLVQLQKEAEILSDASRDIPRSVHPAVWQRKNGDKVLHISPWQADGVAGQETPQGDAMLEELIQQMFAGMKPYWHDWKPSDMLIWDNWRFLHSAGGYDPQYGRDVRRTTIQGDYGLGCLLEDWQGRAAVSA